MKWINLGWAIIFFWSFPVWAGVEYGFFERSSDGKFQSLCPVNPNGDVICTYTSGFQKTQIKVDTVDLGAHQQNLRTLESLSPLSFYAYDEAIRRLIPSQNFLLNGFYVKYDTRTILIGFAHYYTNFQVSVPVQVRMTVSAILRILVPVYQAQARLPTPLIRKSNLCPILVGRYDCGRNQLLVTQRTYGVDELYVFTYSDRTAAFDFAANDVGIKNANDKYLAKCTPQGLTLDGSIMRLAGLNRDLEFLTGTSSSVCKRMSSSSWRSH